MNLGLENKSVIVTGAASNIGRAIALAFAAEGSRLVVADNDDVHGPKTTAAAKAAGAADARFELMDVTDPGSVEATTAGAVAAFGAIDILVNNVGWDQPRMFLDQDRDHWRRLLDLNLVGALAMTRAVLPHMIEAKGGAIVSISSIAGFGEAREAVYGAAKAGINSFMKSITREYGRHGIRANAVAPGLVVPESDDAVGPRSLWRGREDFFSDAQIEKARKFVPLGKHPTAEDIANAVLFLASERMAGHVSGQVLAVSGGYVAG